MSHDVQSLQPNSILVPKEGAIDGNALFLPSYLAVPESPYKNSSKISDDEIDFRCAIARVNVPKYSCFLKRDMFEDYYEYRFVVEVLHLSLSYDHFTASRWRISNLHPSSVVQMAYRLRRLLKCVRDDRLYLHEVNQDWLDGWLESLEKVDSTTIIAQIQIWRRIALYAPLLSFRGIEFDPWGKRSATKISGYRPTRENKTPRVPEEIYGPAMRWAFFYTDHALDDILSSRRALEKTASSRAPVWVSDERLNRYLERLKTDGKRVPLKPDGTPAWFLISRQAGLSIALVRARRARVEQAISELGYCILDEDHGWALLPETSTPWRTGLAGKLARASLLEIQHCIAACYLIIGVLSGMRDSEVTNLREGCLRVELDQSGKIRRYKVHGRIFKGKKDRKGVEHEWVVIEPVARAIGALIKIKAHLSHIRKTPTEPHLADLLFIQPTDQGGSPALTQNSATGYLNSFAAHCHQLALDAAKRNEAEAAEIRSKFCIPFDARGRLWHWTSKQLRRTIAWFIANEPFGIVAGRIQFGQAAELMFEGYAGTSPSGFRDEIEQEREFARLSDIIELYEDHLSGQRAGGPFGKRLSDEFDNIQQSLGDLPGVIVDEARRNKMLKNLAVTLHPGFLNDCFYYAEHARCRKSSTDKGPNWSTCDPHKCPNSCLTKRHQVAIIECIEDAEAMRKRPRLSSFQAKAIDNQIESYRSLLTAAGADELISAMGAIK